MLVVEHLELILQTFNYIFMLGEHVLSVVNKASIMLTLQAKKQAKTYQALLQFWNQDAMASCTADPGSSPAWFQRNCVSNYMGVFIRL